MNLYQHYTVRELWEMVAHENAADHAEALRGWEAKRSMLGAQIGNLRRLRQKLTDAWRPEGSPAAQAFLDQLDQTIAAMTDAQDAASNASTVYSKVTDALMQAQRQIKPLYDLYDDHHAAWRAYLARTPAGPMIKTLPESWAPSVEVPGFVTDAILHQHQSELDRQARAIMESTDTKVSAATAKPIVMPRMNRYDNGASPQPMKPYRGRGAAQPGTEKHLTSPIFDPPAPSPTSIHDGPEPLIPQAIYELGPFLTGTPIPTVPSVFTSTSSNSSEPRSLAYPTTPLLIPPTASRISRALTPSNGLIERSTSEPGVGGHIRTSLGEHGVVGNRSTDRGRTRQPAERGTSSRSAEGLGREEQRQTGGGWRDRTYEAYTQRQSKRGQYGDEAWEVAEGVPPVLQAPPVRPAGDIPPGVIGIDR